VQSSRVLLGLGFGLVSACAAVASLDDHITSGADASAADAAVSDGPPAGDAGSDACGSTQDNSSHCGRCGHDCRGGTCVGGLCQPEELATSQDKPRGLTVRNGNLFWLLDDGSVRACTTSACKSTLHVVADAGYSPTTTGFSRVAADGDHVYWNDFYKVNPVTIWWTPIDGGPVEAFAQGGADGGPGTTTAAVAVDDAGVYWSGDYGVYRCPKTGGPCANPINVGPTGAFTRTMAESEGYIFWVAWGPDSTTPTGSLFRAPKDAVDVPNPTLAPGLFNPRDVAAKDGIPYFTVVEDGGRTGRVMTYDGLAVRQIVGDQFEPTLIAVDADDVYWVGAGTGEIRRCPRAGCIEAEVLATKQANPQGLVLDGQFVYWSVGGTGKIVRVAK
jgi:hypothetical protein